MPDASPARSDLPAGTPDDVVSRIAAIDDYIAGLGDRDALQAPSVGDLECEELAGMVDLVLLLRQSAAAGGVCPAPPPEAPRQIGRYEILAQAGEGGFSTVWKAYDPLLRRHVALKIRRADSLLSADTRRRFIREAEIASRLTHPQIVTIYEVGVDDGREFIAQEFCAGGSLAAWLLRHPGPIDARSAARLILALARAVDHAHGEGVIHRDIKPANILLAPLSHDISGSPILAAVPGDSCAGFTVKLADFGLGKAQDDESGSLLTQLTRTGASMGTPAWMAPEQIDPALGPVGPATDVHGLGLVLDRLLTGRGLRDGRTPAEMYRQALFDEAPSADRIVAGVPRDLAAVCLACLAKQPSHRYPSAAHLADDLSRWLDKRPTQARPLSPLARAARRAARRPLATALLAATLLASMLAGWAVWERSRASLRVVDQERQIATREAAAELRRGFEALRNGNVKAALVHLRAARAIDAGLADSLAGRWLERRSHEEQRMLLTPSGNTAEGAPPRDLFSITISPDGRTAAVAGADGRLRLLDGLERGDDGPHVTSVVAHDEINDVCFSADGAMLATVGQDGRICWWSRTPVGLTMLGENDPAAGPLFAVAFLSDGRSLAVGGEDRVIRVVPLDSPADARQLFAFEPPPGRSPDVESLVALGGGRLAASCGDMVTAFDELTGSDVCEFERPASLGRNAVRGGLRVSRDGTRLIACGTDAQAHVWEIATGRLILSLPTHPSWVQGSGFSPAGSLVATGCRDGSIRFFTADSGIPRGRLVGHEGRVWSVAFESEDSLLSVGEDGTVRRWKPQVSRDAAVLREIPLPSSNPFVVQLVADPEPATADAGATLLALNNGGELMRVNLAQGSAEMIFLGGRRAASVAFEPSHGKLAISHSGTTAVEIAIASSATVTPLGSVPLPADNSPHAAIACWLSPEEVVVATGSGSLLLCSADLQRIASLANHVDRLNDVVRSPAGSRRIAMAGKKTAILTLPVGWGDRVQTLPLAIDEEACRIVWSADGSQVAVGTRTGRVLLFDAATGVPQGSLVAHERRIEGLAYSADGRAIVSADASSIRISDAVSRATLDELRPGWNVVAIHLRSDALVIAGSDGEDVPHARAHVAIMDFNRP